MVWVAFASDKPVLADSGSAYTDFVRNNLMALRDMIIMGAMEDWLYSQSGGTAERPTTILYSKGTERVRLTVTWGSSGGSNGNPTVILYEYDEASGASYDTIGTMTLTYDSSGNLTSSSWT